MGESHTIEVKLHVENLSWYKVSGTNSCVFKDHFHYLCITWCAQCYVDLLRSDFFSRLRVWLWHISFITISYEWSMQQWISSFDMGFFYKLLMIISVVKVMMLFSGYFFLSTLMILTVMNCNNCWYISLTSVSTLILFLVSILICNHFSNSVMKRFIWF